jgi:hypothetical protein
MSYRNSVSSVKLFKQNGKIVKGRSVSVYVSVGRDSPTYRLILKLSSNFGRICKDY